MSTLKQVEAKNFGKHGEISVAFPQSGLITFTGENNAGKTTMLQMILSMYCGAAERTADLIKKGAERGEVEVTEIDDDGIERRIKLLIRPNTTRVEVTTIDGATRVIAEKDLKERWNEITFYPQRFMANDDKVRVKMIGDALQYVITPEQQSRITELSVLLDTDNPCAAAEPLPAIKKMLKSFESARQMFGQHQRTAEEDLAQYANTPDDLDTAVLEQLPTLKEQLGKIEQSNMARARLETQYQSQCQRVKELEQQLEAAKAERSRVGNELEQTVHIDPQPLRDRITELTGLQQQATMIEAKKNTAARVENYRGKYETYTGHIEWLRDAIKVITSSAGMPEGVEIKDGALLYNGMPFNREGTARKFLASVKIGMLTKPKLQAILVDEISVMDDAVRAELDTLAKEYGFQVFGTAPSTEVGHVIEING